METSTSTSWVEKKMQRMKATLMMIVAELIIAGFSVSYKLASNNGMHMSVLIAYRYLFASIFIFPLALLIERNNRPKLTWMILFQAFLCAIFGGPMAQNLYAEGLVLTSATFVAAVTNLISPFTFILAVLFRMEKVEIGKIGGKAKVVGTLVGVSGAMLLTFYRGQQLNTWSTHVNLLHGGQHMDGHVAATHKTSTQHHIIGSVLAFAASLSLAFYLILQTKMSVNYPCHYSSTFLLSVMGFIQSLAYALSTERSWSQWTLGWNIRLFSVLFMGIASALVALLVMASTRLMGPLFTSTFNPLILVFVAIADFLVLDKKLHFGSVLGSVIIIVGLYMVLWGKAKDIKISKPNPSGSSKDVPNTTLMTRENVPTTRSSFTTFGEGDESHIPKGYHEVQEIVEEV